MHYRNPKGKFILSPQEQRQGPRFKVSSEGLSPEIDILIRSPVHTNRGRRCLTRFTRLLTVAVCQKPLLAFKLFDSRSSSAVVLLFSPLLGYPSRPPNLSVVCYVFCIVLCPTRYCLEILSQHFSYFNI